MTNGRRRRGRSRVRVRVCNIKYYTYGGRGVSGGRRGGDLSAVSKWSFVDGRMCIFNLPAG